MKRRKKKRRKKKTWRSRKQSGGSQHNENLKLRGGFNLGQRSRCVFLRAWMGSNGLAQSCSGLHGLEQARMGFNGRMRCHPQVENSSNATIIVDPY
jgi:hypothetical protein